MEFVVRLLLIIVKFVALFVHVLQKFVRRSWPRVDESNANQEIPGIGNRLLTLSIQELRVKLCERQLTAVELVSAYVERIKAVNLLLNVVVEERYEAAILEARRIDERIAATSNVQELFDKQPLLGMPVTVKESCALKGMSFAVGCKPRKALKAGSDGVVVARMRAAGAIPLLVSATPEFCYSTDTDTLLNGRSRNPYDLAYTPGGSSGGEGALNGAGASLFGIGSDIAGSIRIPSLFCGVFGHKPTGGTTSVVGHFPESSDEDFQQYLVLGPMTRFATDLAQLLEIMAGEQAAQLRLREPVQLKQLKVYYALGFNGLNGCMHQAVNVDIKYAINKAVQQLQSLGLDVKPFKLLGFCNSLEMALGGIARLNHMPYVKVQGPHDFVLCATLIELLRSLCGKSKHTTNALIFDLMRRANAFMPRKKLDWYRRIALALADDLDEMLGEDGVLIFPTMHATACRHGWTPLQLWGVDYTLIFNVLGMPATHVPMGRNAEGLPIGFSVIAAPYQDRLCLRLAVELEHAFGGWQAPTPHKFA